MNVSHCQSSPWPGHDSSVGEWMYLTVSPLYGRVMIAQWKNECISLSVLPVARVMIAQWENECISLSVLSMARVLIAQWENECISLSVLPEARIMIAQWENECISLSVLSTTRVQFPVVAEYFKGFIPGWSHSANPPWASAAENGSISRYKLNPCFYYESMVLFTVFDWTARNMAMGSIHTPENHTHVAISSD